MENKLFKTYTEMLESVYLNHGICSEFLQKMDKDFIDRLEGLSTVLDIDDWESNLDLI